MEAPGIQKRKLIDLKPFVFDALSAEASRRKISLKRLIENTLEEQASQIMPESTTGVKLSPAIRRLIGSAKPVSGSSVDFEDERLKYLLSK